ncbi:hypothetical protein G7Y89_g4704 [Cudoniella acicularis]|uniref:Uncharacterized protein n=1 Tax=Cudoniella acicularis TaxID=354080 RepID=A0A8H4RRY7_9HELO|nr:hypothetical protein G7Y89_g4704 [Cudoniella acicularis]
MAGLVRLEAAPGYISSRSFRLPSTFKDSNSTSPVVLATIPSCAKALEVCCLSDVLPISTTTFRRSPYLAINYDPPLRSTLEVYSPRHPLYLHHPLHLDSSHNRRLINSTDHRIVRLRQHRDRCLRFLTTRYPTIEAALRSYINTTLKVKFSLDMTSKPKPEATEEDYDDKSDAGDSPKFDVDDLFDSNDDDDAALEEGIDEDTSYDSGYGTEERDATMTDDVDDYSPSVVDELREALGQACDAAELDKFREANPKPGGRDLLAIEVSLRHYKGVDNKPKPTTFLFRENPLPILYPISYILARAIRDDTILVDGYISAEPFYATNLRGENIKAIKVKSLFQAMLYSTYTFYISRLGRDSGLEDRLTSYCFRRGAASDSIRDQVLRHGPNTGVFSAAYRDELIRAFTHMSIRYNPGAPKKVPVEIIKPLFVADPDIVDLKRRVKELYIEIK